MTSHNSKSLHECCFLSQVISIIATGHCEIIISNYKFCFRCGGSVCDWWPLQHFVYAPLPKLNQTYSN
jgi:hypothetical protein